MIVDEVGAQDKLWRTGAPDGKQVPLKIGDTLELNDHRARGGRHLPRQPHVPIPAGRLHHLHPRDHLRAAGAQAALVRARQGRAGVDRKVPLRSASQRHRPGRLHAEGFEKLTYDYFMKYTGIPINFGIAVSVGIHRRHRHCRADVLQFHARQPAPLRRAQGDGRIQRRCCCG